MARLLPLLALLPLALGHRVQLSSGQLEREEAKEIVRGENGQYELGRKLGSGAYGTVYLATDGNGKSVVVKKIDISASPEAVTSFNTERSVWQHMQTCPGYPHPNVIQYFEVLKPNDRQGIVVMELAGGGMLSSLLYNGVSAENALRGERTALGSALLTDEAQAKKLFGQLAAGAQWLAACGVIHKDLKPDNIMLSKAWDQGGVLKIIDFGLAAVLARGQSGPLANMYYNLEQSIDIASNPLRAQTFDDFALGLILAEIGTGVPPYFNPPFDYFSEKQGNLEKEKGILYILADKATCAKGDKGLWYPKKDLAQGVVSLRSAVKEVAGRSIYFLKKGTHFPYTSAKEKSFDDAAVVAESWLYSSAAAMSLLSDLMQWDEKKRIDPRTLLSSEWLQGLGGAVENTGGAAAKGPTTTGLLSNPPAPATTTAAPAPEAAAATTTTTLQVATGGPPPCQGAQKVRSAPSICNLAHRSPSKCSVRLSCRGGAAQVFVLEPASTFGGGHVDNCYNCQLVA